MKLTPGKSTVVSAPLIEESPLCIECRVKEIVALGSHDMFIADVVNVRADTSRLNTETGKLELASQSAGLRAWRLLRAGRENRKIRLVGREEKVIDTI